MRFLTEVSGPPATVDPSFHSSRLIFQQIEEWAKRSPDQAAFAVDQQNKVVEYDIRMFSNRRMA